MTKVQSFRFLRADDRIYFGGSYHNQITAIGETGKRDDRDKVVCQMTLNELTGIISLDRPGESTAVHISRVAPVFEPSIPLPEPVRAPPAEYVAPPPPVKLSKPELDAAHGFDVSGDDIDDREVAKLLQGEGAKKAVKQRAKKKGIVPAPKPFVPEETDAADADAGADE